MIGVSEIVELVGSLSSGLGEIRACCDRIPSSFFLPAAKRNVEVINLRLETLNGQVASLRSEINTSFPEICELIYLYSDATSDISSALAITNKVAELFELAPFDRGYMRIFISQIQQDYSRIRAKVNSLPNSDIAERGSLITVLNNSRDCIRDMHSSDVGNAEIQIRLLNSLSTQYSDALSILSDFLNRTLLRLNPHTCRE
ncbi:MAG: hypothetical protein F6J97_17705 [Leptolyngbya sp. SIO4C1]|nr:hypothetical protein [Leptolyngbya sp. SIO4C1]